MFQEIPLNVHLLEFDAVTGDFDNVTDIDTITGCGIPITWRGAPPGRFATVVAAGGRQPALIVAADLSPRVEERCLGGGGSVRCHAA